MTEENKQFPITDVLNYTIPVGEGMFHADQRPWAWLDWIYLHICRCSFSAKLPFMVTKQLYLTTFEWGGDVVWVCGLMRKTSFLIMTALLPIVVRLPLLWNISRVVDVDDLFYIGICHLFCCQMFCCYFTGIVKSIPTHRVLSEYKCVKSFCSTGIIWYKFRVNISSCKGPCYLTFKFKPKLISAWICCSEGPAGPLWKHLPLIWHGVEALMNAAPPFFMPHFIWCCHFVSKKDVCSRTLKHTPTHMRVCTHTLLCGILPKIAVSLGTAFWHTAC